MKKIDSLLLKSFIGPFVVSFGIALFVLIMQFLWLYIDDIAGKGVSILLILELLFYWSVTLFPMALPIAVLLASVMIMGNLAERYELSSMKSAGVSLLRVMRSLIVVSAGIALFSYVCSDFLIPIAALKAKSRLFDIRRQKPALSLETGVFNDDFRQFIIRIGEKQGDGETIGKVMIEDLSNTGRMKMNKIAADSGQMFTTRDKRYFVMNLYRGTQYQEPNPNSDQKRKYPFIRTSFKSWEKVWDMQEFTTTLSDEDRWKGQRSMLSMNQLRGLIDSLGRTMNRMKADAVTEITANINREPLKAPETATDTLNASATPPPVSAPAVVPPRDGGKPVEVSSTGILGKAGGAKPTVKAELSPALQINTLPQPADYPRQEINKPIKEYGHFIETFREKDRTTVLSDAQREARMAKNSLELRKAQLESKRKETVKAGYELYIKYSFALVCFVFLFVGGPMGAIIRKGGFGYPILVSIIFFVMFVMLTVTCRKLAETYILTPLWAALMPCIVFIPLAAFLTTRAMNDSEMIRTDRLEQAFKWIAARFQRKKISVAA